MKNLDAIKIEDYINTNITNIKNLENTSRFLLCNELIKDYCNSTIFTDFIINDLLKGFNKYLYTDKWIDNNINWHNNIEMIRHYFISYFMKNYNIIFENVFTSSLDHDNLEFFGNVESYLTSIKENQVEKQKLYDFQDKLFKSHLKKELYYKNLSYFLI